MSEPEIGVREATKTGRLTRTRAALVGQISHPLSSGGKQRIALFCVFFGPFKVRRTDVTS